MRTERMTAAISLMCLVISLFIHHDTYRVRTETAEARLQQQADIKHLLDSIDQLNSELITTIPGFEKVDTIPFTVQGEGSSGWMPPLDTTFNEKLKSYQYYHYRFYLREPEEHWYMKEDSSCYHVDKHGQERPIPIDSFMLRWHQEIMRQKSILI